MFFNKHKKIGAKFSAIAIMLCEEQVKDVNEILSNKQFSEIEVQRLKFCLSIVNICQAMWWVNFFTRNTRQTEKILDSMLENFMKTVENSSSMIRMGDFIVDPTEKLLIDMAMGGVGINDDTITSYRTIVPVIYNKRVGQYSDALSERAKIASDKEGRKFSLDPVAKLLVKHFTGNEWEKHVMLATRLSLVLGAYNIEIGNVVKDML